MKSGPWDRCPECGNMPIDNHSKARHLLVSDKYFGKEELDEMSRKVKNGEIIEFKPEMIEQIARDMKNIIDSGQLDYFIARRSRMMKICLVFLGVVLLGSGLIGLYAMQGNENEVMGTIGIVVVMLGLVGAVFFGTRFLYLHAQCKMRAEKERQKL